MTQPLALILYEKLLPGSQIANRLQDLNYRVQTLTNPNLLVDCAEEAKPLLVLADLEPSHAVVFAALNRLRQNPGTKHLPIIAFSATDTPELRAAAEASGVSLFVSEAAILNHLPQLLDQALQIE